MNGNTFKELLNESTHVDLKRRKELEKTLAKEARQHIRSLAESIASDTVTVRRGAVEILRRISTDEGALRLLVERLGIEPDVKTRRRIANAIADSGDCNIRGALFDQLEREEHRFVQASLILALGKLGFRNWPKHWLDFTDKEGPVAEAMRKARTSSITQADISLQNKQSERRPEGTFLLQDYPGLEPLVKLELQLGHAGRVLVEAPGWLVLPNLKADAMVTLERLRTIVADYHLALSVPAYKNDTKAVLSKAIENMLSSAPYMRDGCAFRLSLPTMDTRNDYRKLVVRLSRHIEQTTNWVNNPSDYDVDLRLVRLDSKDAIIWRDRRWLSSRQTESRAVVPASIHPSVAAALCFAATESNLARTVSAGAGRVLLDPCCGGGTILSEWLTIFPQAHAIGYDISETAIQLSQRNLAAFETRSQIRVADMRDLPLKASSVDFIVCNLPFGIRVKHGVSNRTLYAQFISEALRVLRPGGTLVTYTADQRAIEWAFRSEGWKDVKPLTRVKAGGLDVTIHRRQKD